MYTGRREDLWFTRTDNAAHSSLAAFLLQISEPAPWEHVTQPYLLETHLQDGATADIQIILMFLLPHLIQ